MSKSSHPGEMTNRMRPTSAGSVQCGAMSQPTPYEIVLRGHPSPRLLRPLADDFMIDASAEGTTRLVGAVGDQSHLHGILAHLTSINLELISIAPVSTTAPLNHKQGTTMTTTYEHPTADQTETHRPRLRRCRSSHRRWIRCHPVRPRRRSLWISKGLAFRIRSCQSGHAGAEARQPGIRTGRGRSCIWHRRSPSTNRCWGSATRSASLDRRGLGRCRQLCGTARKGS